MMKPTEQELFRVEQARSEVGVTGIRPRAAFWFVLSWLLLVVGVLAVDQAAEWNRQEKGGHSMLSLPSFAVVGEFSEIVRELREQGMSPEALTRANRRLLKQIRETEETIEEQGAIAEWLRPWAQKGLLVAGAGNEKVYPGQGSWLFYRPDVDLVTGPGFLDKEQLRKRKASGAEWEEPVQPDPVKALLDFKHQLSARGIRLLVVPTPVKPELLPDVLSSRYPAQAVVRNASYRLFVDRLREAGIRVADVALWLQEYQRQEQKRAFLRTDTHWTPEAMQWVARRLADEVVSMASWNERGSVSLKTESRSIANQGDIRAMLDLPSGWNPYKQEQVRLERRLGEDGSNWKADPAARLLVLGDSFCNIYSLAAMGWGDSAGLVEQLSYALGQPLDRIVRNDQGAVATRRILSRELARGRDRLAGKKVVLYQFANRELAFGDWRTFPLELKTVEPSTFLALRAGEELHVRGIVREVSSVPRPGTVPYRDHVVAVHLVDITEDDGSGSFAQAVVFLRSMVDNRWTRAAGLRPGDEVELLLRSWSDVAEKMDGLNRSELDDPDLQLQLPVWGEFEEELNP